VHLPYPDPSDAFYAHIPSTCDTFILLIALATTASMRHGWQMRGSFTSLEDLEVAFKADTQDCALIDHITSSFPNLHLLQVHRYRAEGETAADVESALNYTAQSLSSLHYLHLRNSAPTATSRPPPEKKNLRNCSNVTLRNLDLCIYLFHEEPIRQINLWPPGLSLPETLVLESMEKVFLPYPDPDDTFYKHLPSTLRELHLVDRPRYYRWDGGLTRFTKPTLITATELLRILKQLPARCIFMEQLEVAFRADGQELALYDYIAAAFPNLRVLQLHRYRISGETESDIELTLESIARDVSSLRSLRHFRAYLNIPSDDYKSQDTHEQKARYMEEEFKALHHHYAMIIAQHCSPALQIVEFLSAWFHGSHYWLRWHVRLDSEGRPLLVEDEHQSWVVSRLEDRDLEWRI
ncbi:hypothetical protein EVG20_g7865, partial [Dentipellis fragilis]